MPANWLLHLITRLILGWDAGACLYLLLAVHMMFASSHEKMRRKQALREDEGQWLILLLVVIASGAGLAALGADDAGRGSCTAWHAYAHIALVTLTLLACWLFTQLVFALYAHDYYLAPAQDITAGWSFPVTSSRNLCRFCLFCLCHRHLGTQTRVGFTTRRMRVSAPYLRTGVSVQHHHSRAQRQYCRRAVLAVAGPTIRHRREQRIAAAEPGMMQICRIGDGVALRISTGEWRKWGGDFEQVTDVGDFGLLVRCHSGGNSARCRPASASPHRCRMPAALAGVDGRPLAPCD